MKYLGLRGLPLKNDVLCDLFETYDVQVVYECDRTHKDLPDEYRAEISDLGLRFAFDERQVFNTLFMQQGRVTSTEVLEAMRENYPELLEDVDPRFMGCVFRRGWRRIGYEGNGKFFSVR